VLHIVQVRMKGVVRPIDDPAPKPDHETAR
jgi:hypothetical protein